MRRRSWLKFGAGAAVVLALGGGAAALLAPGLRNGRLTAASRGVMRSLASAVLDGILPVQPAQRTLALDQFLPRVDTLLQGLPPHAQAELSQLLALLGTTAGRRGLAGLHTSWAEAQPAEVQAAMQSMRTSSLALRRQAYQALHDIAGAAYFSDPSTWTQIGYPGPVAI